MQYLNVLSKSRKTILRISTTQISLFYPQNRTEVAFPTKYYLYSSKIEHWFMLPIDFLRQETKYDELI